MDQQAYLNIISGKTSGPFAAIVRLLLRVPEFLYLCTIRLRNSLYSKGVLKSHRVSAMVFSIGNITTGGTGKTPFVIWLCNLLKQKNIDCAILSRGYKAIQEPKLKLQSCLDEPAILAESCPEVPIIVNPDRVAGASEAISRFAVKALIMDDGFQHRRLSRDLDIIIIDATRPFGYGKLLPAGLLREPVNFIKRADAIVITRCNQVDAEELTQLEQKLQQVCPGKIIAKTIHYPIYVKTINNTEINTAELKYKKVFAFCGIGNPNAFFNTIRAMGDELVGWKVFNDHYHYSEDILANIYEQAKELKAELILTTHKDWTKAASLIPVKPDIVFAYLEIQIKFLEGEEKLIGLIGNTLAGKMPEK